jgi:ubiquinone/menaquinone biosynthesis C-methylase UbiE
MPRQENARDHGDPYAFLDPKASAFPLSVGAFRSLLEIQPQFEAVVTAARRHDDDFWRSAEARCRETLHLLDGDPRKFSAAVEQWVNFTSEFLAKQRKFLKNGQYGSKSFEAIRSELYEDEEKMRNFYLIALMFSFLFSSNYVGFFAFLERRLLPVLAEARAVCDVGCGHGVYLSQMLTAAPRAIGVGVDISSASLETTARLLSFNGIEAARYRLCQGDVQVRLPVDDASQDAMTCFEVIEHLEHPEAALAELRRAVRPGGLLCMSTAIRMESVDHIHLFQSPDEVRQLVTAGGFNIVADEIIPLSTEDISDPEVRDRLIADARVPLGIVLLVS